LLHSHPPHPSLHSFPTRRSSDLLAAREKVVGEHPRAYRERAAASVRVDGDEQGERANEVRRDSEERLALAQRLAHKSQLAVFERSEEHTSELQSQSNLVCRLLLE